MFKLFYSVFILFSLRYFFKTTEEDNLFKEDNVVLICKGIFCLIVAYCFFYEDQIKYRTIDTVSSYSIEINNDTVNRLSYQNNFSDFVFINTKGEQIKINIDSKTKFLKDNKNYILVKCKKFKKSKLIPKRFWTLTDEEIIGEVHY